MKNFLVSVRLLAVLTLVTGIAYPFAVWVIGRTCFRDAAEGSLIRRDNRIVGSSLLAQKIADPRYFQPRPSAGDYATVASGASNLTWTNAKLAAAVAERRTASGNGEVPAELLTASGSGLDPELSPEAVQFQVARVAESRHLSATQRHALDELIARHIEGGHLSPRRVNVLLLNLALDASLPPS